MMWVWFVLKMFRYFAKIEVILELYILVKKREEGGLGWVWM